MNTAKVVAEVVEALIITESYKATKFVNPKLVVNATRRLFMKKINKRENIDIVLKIGRPNYDEREFIKVAQKANEPFPIKKIQLKAVEK